MSFLTISPSVELINGGIYQYCQISKCLFLTEMIPGSRVSYFLIDCVSLDLVKMANFTEIDT